MTTPTTGLSVRPSPNRQQTQLALLAAVSVPQTSTELLARTLYDGGSSTQSTGTVLASDVALAASLSKAAVYRFNQGSVSPERDFVTLSVSTSPQEVAAALSRLQSAFLTVRGELVVEREAARNALETLEDSGQDTSDALKRFNSCDHEFMSVNASYILVISTTHALFDRSVEYRSQLTSTFLDLLKLDPFLKKLAPTFEDLYSSQSVDAHRVALKQFFEVFCEQATEPFLYDETFGALVQAILLRELKHVIADEKKSAGQKTLAPYLAAQFENRVRAELEIAKSHSQEPQPVISALRLCSAEAALLMNEVTKYLLDSSNSKDRKLTIPAEDARSCEVLLSVGCLLPEIGISKRLAELLHYVDDLNPALVLVFASALKFTLADKRNAVQIDPTFLIKRSLAVVSDLDPERRTRLLDEVLLPLADEFALTVRSDLDLWRKMPESLRVACIEQILARKIEVIRADRTTQDIGLDQAISDLLLVHLQPQRSESATLNKRALQWLARRGASGDLSEVQAAKIGKIFVLQENLIDELGISEEVFNKLLAAGGLSALKFLSEIHNYRSLFVERATHFYSSNQPKIQKLLEYSERAVFTPLKNALQQYDETATHVFEAEGQVYVAHVAAQESAGVGTRKEKLERHLAALTTILEERYDYLGAVDKLVGIEGKLKDAEDALRRVSSLSVKERHQQGLQTAEEDRKKIVETLRGTKQQIENQLFPLPSPLPGQLSDYGSKSVSIRMMRDIEEGVSRSDLIVGGKQGGIDNAKVEAVASTEKLRALKKDIRELLSHATKLFGSPLIQKIPPDKFEVATPGAGALLALFCRITLAAKLLRDDKSSDARKRCEVLEREICIALKESVKKFGNHDDAMLILTELAKFATEDSTILSHWPEAESAGDTTVAYTSGEIPDGVSLSEYLYQRLRSDLDDPAIAFLRNEPGWDESFHAPIIDIFTGILRRSSGDKSSKIRAMKAVAPGVMHWANKINKFQEAKVDAAASGEEVSRSLLPFIEAESLIVPCTAFLRASLGRGEKVSVERLETTCCVVVDAAMTLTATADDTQIRGVLVPLLFSLEKAISDPLSRIYNHKDLVIEYRATLERRAKDLLKQKAAQQKTVESKVSAAVLPQPDVQGISFEALSGPAGIALPAPSRPIEEHLNRLRIGNQKD